MVASLPEGLAYAQGIEGLLVIGVIYAILTVISKIKEASQRGQAPPRPRPARPQSQGQLPRTRPPMQGGKPVNTQLEGLKLEDLLKVLGEAAGVPTTQGPLGRHSPTPLPSAEEVEERESLEVEEQVQNLETGSERPGRREVDFDDEAEGIVQRRIRQAQERDRSLNRADHRVFDERIRKIEADKTAVAKKGKPRLSDMVVWREILGPPVSLRDPNRGEQ